MAQAYRSITGVLGNLAAAFFAFFGKALERRIHRGEQLNNNAGRDVRNYPEGKNRKDFEVTAGNESQEVKHPPLGLELPAQYINIDTRRRDEHSKTVHSK